MNERIKELAKQAGAGNRAGVSGLVFRDEELQKFAELIIKECAQVSAGFVPGYGLEPFSELFNKHYGFKE